MQNMLKECKVTRVLNATAAGATNVNTTGVDMSGFEGVLFVADFGALTATQVTKMKLQESSDNGVVDAWADITGSLTAAMADADSSKLLLCEDAKPRQRYVRAVVVRGTANAVIDAVVAIQYGARTKPLTQGSTVSAQTLVVGAAEGTA